MARRKECMLTCTVKEGSESDSFKFRKFCSGSRPALATSSGHTVRFRNVPPVALLLSTASTLISNLLEVLRGVIKRESMRKRG